MTADSNDSDRQRPVQDDPNTSDERLVDSDAPSPNPRAGGSNVSLPRESDLTDTQGRIASREELEDPNETPS